MVTKEFEMFYFDDETFIGLIKQIEKELKLMVDYTHDNAHYLRLAYQKFELFLAVYNRSRKGENIDDKPETRLEIASEINQISEQNTDAEISEEYFSEYFLNAREKLERVIEDLIYQITIRNLATNSPAGDGIIGY